MLKKTFGSIFLLMVGSSLSAQRTVELDPVNAISYPIIEESRVTGAGKVQVVSEFALDQLVAGDLTAALRRIPGVSVSRYNRVGAFGGSDGGGIYIRGHGRGRPGSNIGTLIDGVPLFVGIWTHPLIDTLSVDLAGSIEVAKSPQPFRLGNMGFGSINLIPKLPSRPGYQGEVELSYGEDQTYLARGEIGYQGQHHQAILALSHRESEGHRLNADGEVDALYGHWAWSWSENWTSSFLVSFTESWANDPEPIGISIPIDERYETSNRFYLGKLSYSDEEWAVEVKLHYEDGEGDWRQWHVPPPPPFPAQTLQTTTNYDNYGIKTEATRLFGEATQLQFGVDWDRFGGSVLEAFALGPTNDFGEEQFEILAPFLGVFHNKELSDGGLLKFDAGIRFVGHSEFDSEATGQLGVIYAKDNYEAYFHAARAVNYPGVYVTVFGRRPPPWNVGDWTSLNAEEILHYEAGVKLRPSAEWTIDVSFFSDEVSDSIQLVAPPPVGFIENLGDYEIQGTEVMVQYRIENISLFAGGAWMDASRPIPSLPEWTGSVGVLWQRGNWSFSTDYQRVDRQWYGNPRFSQLSGFVDAYSLWNARLGYELVQENGKSWEVYLYGENLSDEDYAFRPGYPMPGTSFTLGFKHTW